MDFLSDKPGGTFNPRQSILPGARGPRVGGGPKSGVSGRRFGRARGDSRGSFRLEWLRIEFWGHPRSLFSKPTLELRRLAPAREGGIRWIFGVPGTPCFFSGRCAGQQICPMRAPIKLLHLGENLGGVPRPVVPYGTLPCPPGGRVPLAPGRPGSSGPWAAGKLWPLVIWRICLAAGHLPDPPRWSSHGFAVGSPASGRDSGRARGDSRGSFWMEWLRIGF